MSALSPWAMTLGKLAGATALPWFAGIPALALHALAARPDALAWKLALFVGGAVLIHGLALFGSLLMLQRGVQQRASLVLRAVGGLVVGGIVYAFVHREEGVLDWFGQACPVLPFAALVVMLLAGWSIYGCQRLMCEELQVRTQPWTLPGFIAFASVLIAGFTLDAETSLLTRASIVVVHGVALGLAAAYFAAFALRNDALLPRRLAGAARRADWPRVATLLPPWSIALAVAILCAVVTQVLWRPDVHMLQWVFSTRVATLACVACGVRDLFVIYGIGCSIREDRGELVAVLYLALVYWLLPGIFALTGAHAIGELVTPLPWAMPARALPALLVQAAAALAFAWWAYARRVRPLTAAAGARS